MKKIFLFCIYFFIFGNCAHNSNKGIKPLPDLIPDFSEKSQNWAIMIGINDYSIQKNGCKRLPFAVRDAEEIKKFLINSQNFPTENIFDLSNTNATADSIRACFDNLLKRSKTKDRLIIYFSGHGATYQTEDGKRYGFLVPIDGKNDLLFSSCLPIIELIRYSDLISAKQVLFIIDACFSGIPGVITKGNEEAIEKTNKTQIERLFEGRSRQILTAGTCDEVAVGGEKWNNHSVFTYYLIEGLQGKADYNKDKVVSIKELDLYVSTNVAKDTDGKQNPQFYNLDYNIGQFTFSSIGVAK